MLHRGLRVVVTVGNGAMGQRLSTEPWKGALKIWRRVFLRGNASSGVPNVEGNGAAPLFLKFASGVIKRHQGHLSHDKCLEKLFSLLESESNSTGGRK